MASTKPFSRNPSHTAISGVTNLGDIAIGTSAQNYSANPGGLTWWMGPDESTGYVIGAPVALENQSTPIGSVGNVQFWRTNSLSDSEFLSLANYVKRTFGGAADLATATDANVWLAANNYYTNWTLPATTTTTTAAPTTTTTTTASGGLVTSGLVFNLQTAPSSGTTWTDASGNGYNATLQGSPSYVSNNGGGILLNNADYTGVDFISVPYNISSNTFTVEIVASFNSTSYWATIWGNEAYSFSRGYFAYQLNSTNITWGSPSSNTTAATITASNSIRHWVFVVNGTSKSLYLNGSQLGSTVTLNNPTGGYATGNFYFGSRHTNTGTGNTDRLNNSNSANYPVFYQMRIYNTALSAANVDTNFNAIRSTYGL